MGETQEEGKQRAQRREKEVQELRQAVDAIKVSLNQGSNDVGVNGAGDLGLGSQEEQGFTVLVRAVFFCPNRSLHG